MRRPTFAGARGRLLLFALFGVLLPACASAQAAAPGTPGAAPAGAGTVEIDPIRCWTRTSAGAVRIGETFTVTLTCAVLETELVQAVPDESKLGVTVVQMNPFEVVGGNHPADLRSSGRRFFQYDYNIRMINPDSIGQDVAVPLLQISYRVNSRIAGNQEMQGRELSYVLPVMWVKVMSVVPADATDIRDTRDASFGRIESIAFRAGVLEIVAITLVVLGSLMTLLGLVGIARRARKGVKGVQQREISRPALMRLAARELSTVQREATSGSWTDVLINRAASALRIAAAGLLGRPISQRFVDNEAEAGEGRFVVNRFGRGKRSAVSAAITAENVADALARLPDSAPPHRRQLLEELQTTLSALSAIQYGRPSADRSGADAAVNKAIEIARQARSEHAWPREWLRRVTKGTSLMQRRA